MVVHDAAVFVWHAKVVVCSVREFVEVTLLASHHAVPVDYNERVAVLPEVKDIVPIRLHRETSDISNTHHHVQSSRDAINFGINIELI